MFTQHSNRKARLALALALVPALAGCKLLGIGNPTTASNAPLHERLPDDFGAQQLEIGRAALTEERAVEAIEAFMLAKLYPEQAPAAYNGLAVAYSRMGRTDLTERFFQTAILLAPGDDRYRANLARFYAHNPMPRANATQMAFASGTQPLAIAAPATIQAAALEVATPTAPTVRTLRGGVTVETGGSTMRRVSNREVTVGGGAPSPATMAISDRRPAVVEVGARKQATIPVRVGMAEAPKKPSYPIRIELDQR